MGERDRVVKRLQGLDVAQETRSHWSVGGEGCIDHSLLGFRNPSKILPLLPGDAGTDLAHIMTVLAGILVESD